MTGWGRAGCLGCHAKDQELARLRICQGCAARDEHLKDLQAQMAAMRHAWNVERQEYKTAIDRLLTKEGQAPIGAILAESLQMPATVNGLRSLWDEREPA